MKTKHALVTLGAVVIAGIFLLLAVSRLKSYDRTVSVRGLCEREVKADVAIYPITYQETGNDLVTLYKNVTEKNQIVKNFLIENGIPEKEITIGVPVITDRDANSYNYNSNSRYSLKSVITVYTHNVDGVLALQTKLTSLIEKGIAIGSGNEWENNISYQFAGLNKIKPAMIQEANTNARAAGEQFAKDSKSRLGKIQTASQGLFSIEPRDANTPYIKTVRVVTYVTYYLK